MEDLTNADSPPLRDSLVATAVAFLKNEKVKGSGIEEKKSFLEKKGLTMAEIEESIRICNSPPSIYPPPLPASPSAFSTITSSFSTVVLVAGSSFALYQLYQKFLKPLMFGEQESKDKEVLQQLLSNSRQMNDNLVVVVGTLNDLHRQVARSNSQLLLNNNSQEYKLATNEMKEEIRSLKALLLSRQQFPPAPSTIPPSLPAWQIAGKSASNNIGEHKNSVLNGSKGDDEDNQSNTDNTASITNE